MTLTRFIRASSWHERQDLDPAGEDPWQVRARTWMIELEGSIDRRVWYGKMDRASEGGKCNMASQGTSGKRTLHIELREGAAFEFSQQEYGLKINRSVL